MYCILLATALAAALTGGCQSSHQDIVSFLKAYEHDVSAIEYRVGIPDVISISSPRILEIDRVSQTVRPDGKIALRLLGPVKVVGLTEKEIAAKLVRLLEPYYESPKVQVRVTGYLSKVIYVAGQVGGAGSSGGGGGGGAGARDEWMTVPYTGRDTVMDVLAKVGMSFVAWKSQVKVIRSSPHAEERREIIIDMEHMIATGDTSKNILLMPDDILVVPPTPLGWLGMRIQEVLFPFHPVIEAYKFPATLKAANDVYDDWNDE